MPPAVSIAGSLRMRDRAVASLAGAAASRVAALSVALSLILGACAALAPGDGNTPIASHTFTFRDGGVTRYFELRRALKPFTTEPESWLFVFAGSGCASMAPILPQYFRGLEGESGPLRVFVLEKRHTSHGLGAACSDAFVRDDHPARWVADYHQFIEARLRDASPSRVVLVGISEGGEVVPLLAQRIARTTHVVLLANPGADSLQSYRRQGDKHAIAEVDGVLRALAGSAPPDPDAATARLAGRSFRYWSELPALRTRESLLALDVPVLIGMGEADEMVPVELAHETRDAHSRAGHGSLTLLTFEDADHGLVDRRSGRSRLPDFWHQVDLWLSR